MASPIVLSPGLGTLGADGYEVAGQVDRADAFDPDPVRVTEVAPPAWLSQFNRIAGGAIAVRSDEIAADGIVFSGPCILYGVKVIAVGTSIIVYDNIAASGQRVINGDATSTLGAVITPAGPGVGVQMLNGIYLDLTLGTYMVSYAPGV
jgi:hypothetical protein